MKSKLFITALLSFFYIVITSQNVKLKNWSFKYEYLPEQPLPNTYKTYKVEGYSDATDGIPLDNKFILIGEEYIRGLKNISVVYVKDGVMIGGKVIGVSENKPKEEIPDLKITVLFKNIELVDKYQDYTKMTNLQTNQVENLLVYKLLFKFPYVLRVTDVKTGKNILDTLVATNKTATFPNDYRFDAFGNRAMCNGSPSKPELDLEYNKVAKDLYALSKKTVSKTCMDEVKSILGELYGFKEGNININYFWVKAKSKTFDISDTAVDLMRSIVDTTISNAKSDKHINWHCRSVKTNSTKLIHIWEAMVSDPKYLTEFTDQTDKREYILKMKRNLILAYLFNDDLEKAQQLFNEIKSSTDIHLMGSTTSDQTMSILGNLIIRERRLYDKHKIAFNFY